MKFQVQPYCLGSLEAYWRPINRQTDTVLNFREHYLITTPSGPNKNTSSSFTKVCHCACTQSTHRASSTEPWTSIKADLTTWKFFTCAARDVLFVYKKSNVRHTILLALATSSRNASMLSLAMSVTVYASHES